MDQEPRKLPEAFCQMHFAGCSCLLVLPPLPGLCRVWPPVCHYKLSMLILDSINMFISSDF